MRLRWSELRDWRAEAQGEIQFSYLGHNLTRFWNVGDAQEIDQWEKFFLPLNVSQIQKAFKNFAQKLQNQSQEAAKSTPGSFKIEFGNVPDLVFKAFLN